MSSRVDSITRYWAGRLEGLDVSGFEVTARVLLIARYVIDQRAHLLARFGLSPGEFDVLAALSHMSSAKRTHTGVNAVVLVDAALVTSGAITKRLDRLEKAGLAQRTPDPNDRRATLVKLTPKGRRTIDKAVRLVTTAEAELLSRISERDRKQLLEPLKRLSSLVDRYGEEAEGEDSITSR